MNNQRLVVHMVGTYVPSCTGTEGVSETYYFKQLFVNRLGSLGARVSFEQKLTDALVSMMKRGDVLVILNPDIDLSRALVRQSYRLKVKEASEKIGRGRIVLALQDEQTRTLLQLSSVCQLWPINYAPVYNPLDQVVKTAPAPEEALGIAMKIVAGKNPDVYI